MPLRAPCEGARRDRRPSGAVVPGGSPVDPRPGSGGIPRVLAPPGQARIAGRAGARRRHTRDEKGFPCTPSSPRSARPSFRPGPGRDGPLPPLLVAMTLVTGLVDAFSYLVLGHVFVANMTGNVVFLGFALAGAPGFSIGASIVALASFCLGALVGGQAGKRYGAHRGRLLSTATAVEAVLLGASVVLASLSGSPVTTGFRYSLIFVLATAMGVQNASRPPGRRPGSHHHGPHPDHHRHRRRQHDRRGQGVEIRAPPRRDRRHARRVPWWGRRASCTCTSSWPW